MVERGEGIVAKDGGQVMLGLAVSLRDEDRSGGREARLVMLLIKPTKNDHLPDCREYF